VTAGDDLPHIDEHSAEIQVEPAAAWEALLRVVEGSFGSASTARFARLLGCEDSEASGPRPLATGSTIPGFHVEAAEPGRWLALGGSHRFSRYALIFRIAEREGGVALRAETRAVFPGAKGRAYQALVIGTRVHVLVTRRLLNAVKQRAEAGAPRT
jgi:hypothetical protein